MVTRYTSCYVFSTAPKIAKTCWDYFAFTMFVAMVQVIFEPHHFYDIMEDVELQLMLPNVV